MSPRKHVHVATRLSSSSSTWHFPSFYASANATSADGDGSAAILGYHHDPSPLEPLGVGVKRDLFPRYQQYTSDFTEAFSNPSRVISTTAFIFFACLAPAVGFGGLLSVATGGDLGVVETVASTAASGVIYGATAAQPLCILGSTGPLLALTAALTAVASAASLPFLPLYAWTGLWTAGIMGTMAATSASQAVASGWTRFTDEIFSTLVSIMFVTEAISNIGNAVTRAARLQSAAHGLATLALAATTWRVATTCKKMGTKATSVLLPNKKLPKLLSTLRQFASNFAPTLGVAAACLLAQYLGARYGIVTSKLSLPTTFGTTTGRPWMVNLLQLPVWARWAAAIPAAMATIVIFFETAITHRLMNNKQQFGLRKGRNNTGKGSLLDGMHGDMTVMAALVAVQSVLGLPWLAAATVRTLSHVKALQMPTSNSITSDDTAPRVLEQRVTNLAIHVAMGAMILLRAPRQALTRLVPPAALMGLFLYMGLSTLTCPSNELWSRMVAFSRIGNMGKHDKAVPRWTRLGVPQAVTRRVTAIQMASLGALWRLAKSPSLGVLFPVVLLGLSPLRHALIKCGVVPQGDMDILDGNDNDDTAVNGNNSNSVQATTMMHFPNTNSTLRA